MTMNPIVQNPSLTVPYSRVSGLTSNLMLYGSSGTIAQSTLGHYTPSIDPRTGAGQVAAVGSTAVFGGVTFQKFGSGNNDWVPGPFRGQREYLIATAAARCQCNPQDLQVIFDDFVTANEGQLYASPSNGGSGTQTMTTTAPGSLYRVRTGAASSYARARPTAVGSYGRVFPGGATSKWYIAWRGRKSSGAIPTGSYYGMGIRDEGGGTPFAYFGYHSTASTTKHGYLAWDGADKAVSTVAPSTDGATFNEFHCWRDGTNVYVSADGETPVASSGGTNYCSTSEGTLVYSMVVDTGAAGGDFLVDFDWVFAAGKRAP